MRGNSRSKCDTVGGSPDQSLDTCILGDSPDTGCDGFIYEECDYHGQDAGFTPPPGEIVDATECMEFCQLFQVECKKMVF